MHATCPKCAAPRQADITCPYCGIVYAKYRPGGPRRFRPHVSQRSARRYQPSIWLLVASFGLVVVGSYALLTTDGPSASDELTEPSMAEAAVVAPEPPVSSAASPTEVAAADPERGVLADTSTAREPAERGAPPPVEPSEVQVLMLAPPDPAEPQCRYRALGGGRVYSLSTSELSTRIARARGCVVLLEVFATWCRHCRNAFPQVNTLARELRDDGLVVVALSTDEDRAALTRFVRERSPAFDTFWLSTGGGDVADAVEALGASFPGGIPFFALFDREGGLITSFSGGGAGLVMLEVSIRTLL